MKPERVKELFQALEPEDVLDFDTQGGQTPRIIIHFNAPDGDGTHYAMVAYTHTRRWELMDMDRDQMVFTRHSETPPFKLQPNDRRFNPDHSLTEAFANCPECPHSENVLIPDDAIVMDLICSACGHNFTVTRGDDR